MTNHFRVIVKTKDQKPHIQGPHFGSEADAQEYIRRNSDLIFPGEVVEIARDCDSRIYPI